MIKQKTILAFRVIFLFLSFFLSLNVWSQVHEDKRESLRKSYFRLKNTDPELKDRQAWSNVISDYRDFIARREDLNDKVLFEYGSLLQEYGQASDDNELLDESMDVFERLAGKYPGSAISDDALLKEAELLAVRGASPGTLEDAYRAIIERFPSSDSAEIARVRLSRAKGFTSRTAPESGIEVPYADSRNDKASAALPVVVLDPGHGGEDFGAENEMGLLEKDVVLAVALEAERLINQRGLARAVLTRRTDVFVPLLERVAIANKNNAVVFISLHNNASPKRNQSGMNTYVLDDSSDEASRLLAERENKSGGAQISDLDFIVSDLIQSSKHPKSILLAESIDKSVRTSVLSLWPNPPATRIKKAPFYVLVGARMPCALVELFFLDHETDSGYLADPAFRKSLAQGVAKGIEVFMVRSRA